MQPAQCRDSPTYAKKLCQLASGGVVATLQALLSSDNQLLPTGSRRGGHARVCVRVATSSKDGSVPDVSQWIQELFDDLKVKYDAMENKLQVWIYGGGPLVAFWFSFIVIGAINNIPLLPKLLEFVGLCYSGWFVYRYPLFKSSRKQLAADIQELKLKVIGVPRNAFMAEDNG
ncbi:hypothetical protein L7F22_021643 [Adiantum nelumboides]|nr:hypothetical protein [Adiantum nelumboides]